MFGPGVSTTASATAANPASVAVDTIGGASDMYVARDGQDGMAGHLHPVAFQAQPQLAAAAGQLACEEGLALQHLRPLGHQCAVGSTRHRIFRNADLGHEHARDEIRFGPTRRHSHVERQARDL